VCYGFCPFGINDLSCLTHYPDPPPPPYGRRLKIRAAIESLFLEPVLFLETANLVKPTKIHVIKAGLIFFN
jgi:hypothetical protein